MASFEKGQVAWHDFQTSRTRDAVYGYLKPAASMRVPIFTRDILDEVAGKISEPRDRPPAPPHHNGTMDGLLDRPFLAPIATAVPNAGHFAITEMQTRRAVSIITQNVDGLHQRSGSRNVFELHGTVYQSVRRANADAVVYVCDARRQSRRNSFHLPCSR